MGSALFWVPFTTSTAEGTKVFPSCRCPQVTAGAAEEGPRSPFQLQGALTSCSSVCSPPKEHFDHFQYNLQSAGNLVCNSGCSWFSPSKDHILPKVFFAKGHRRRKIPFLVPRQIWCLCSVNPHFFCHKLISWSADSQGHFSFTTEISLEGAKLFYSLENIKWLRLPQAMK